MNVLISEKCANELKSNKFNVSVNEVSKILSSLNPQTFRQRPDVERVSWTDEEIYVLRYKSLRMFFTFSNNDLVLMSTTAYES